MPTFQCETYKGPLLDLPHTRLVLLFFHSMHFHIDFDRIDFRSIRKESEKNYLLRPSDNVQPISDWRYAVQDTSVPFILIAQFSNKRREFLKYFFIMNGKWYSDVSVQCMGVDQFEKLRNDQFIDLDDHFFRVQRIRNFVVLHRVFYS
jgi:hypothetical protein